jgi:anti-sigma factor RsiW
MSDHLRITDEDLHALIDGELPEDTRAAVANAVADDADLSRRAALFRTDKARLAEVYGRVADAPLPPRWLELIDRAPSRRRFGFPLQTMAAMAAALMLMIGGALVYRQSTPSADPIIQEALAARNDALPASAALSSVPFGTASRTAAASLHMHVTAPDLSRMGYRLVGMHVYHGMPGGGAVELLYRRGNNGVFALYLRRPSGAPRFDQYKQGSLRVCIWQDDVLGAVMTGEMSAAEMQRLASLAYTGLES